MPRPNYSPELFHPTPFIPRGRNAPPEDWCGKPIGKPKRVRFACCDRVYPVAEAPAECPHCARPKGKTMET